MLRSVDPPPSVRAFDLRLVRLFDRWGEPALRISLAIVFIWFGILKPFGMSAAEGLLRATVRSLPPFSPDAWVSIIGWWEVLIGVTFLFRRTIRIAIALLALQMVGTFLPLVLLPEVTFQPGRVPWAPTLEGQYIVKNLVIIAGSMVVGGRLIPFGRRTPA